jgi:hypothetical protein
LHAVFESVYAFDIEPLKKQNLGQAIKLLEKHEGTTPFVVAYATQHGLAGHSIPVNDGLLQAFVAMDVVTPAEAAKRLVPGLERAVPKNKGIEVASILHQLGVEVGKNPYGQAARKLLLELDPTCKDRLPKKPVVAEPVAVSPPRVVPTAKTKEKKGKITETSASNAMSKPEPAASSTKSPAKKSAKQPEAPKKAAPAKKKAAAKGLAKRKPR